MTSIEQLTFTNVHRSNQKLYKQKERVVIKSAHVLHKSTMKSVFSELHVVCQTKSYFKQRCYYEKMLSTTILRLKEMDEKTSGLEHERHICHMVIERLYLSLIHI